MRCSNIYGEGVSSFKNLYDEVRTLSKFENGKNILIKGYMTRDIKFMSGQV